MTTKIALTPPLRLCFPPSDSRGALTSKVIICTLVLTAVVVAVQYCLRQLADCVDLLSFLAICGGLTALMMCAAFAWDWHEARR